MSSLVDLISAFEAGAADLKSQAGLLNDINVYPVVDGDTGTNMVSSLEGALLLASQGSSSKTDGQLLKKISVALLEGGRGNSGVILTACLAGLFDYISEANTLDASSFRAALKAGSELAYRSVRKPVEGTILTAMRGLSDCLGQQRGVWRLADNGAVSLRMAALVAETKTMLPKLAAADVVDSGALGFHILTSGMLLFLPCTGPDAPLARREIRDRRDGRSHAALGNVPTTISERFLQTNAQDDNDWAYCVTALLDPPKASNEKIYSVCETLGGSIDLTRIGQKAKIHIHTNNIEIARTHLEELGTVRDFNHEKMSIAKASLAAAAVQNIEKTPYKVVTDASASISEAMAREFGVTRLQTYVSGHGRTLRDDHVDLAGLFRGMREGHIYRTAHTSSEEARNFLETQLAQCEQLVYVGVGNAYSGTQRVLREVASTHPESKRITIIDSKAASGQLALACIASCLYARGNGSHDGLLEYVQGQVDRCREYLVIDDLKHLARGGRIGKVKASLAGLLSIKPIVGHGDDGAVTYGKARSHDAAFDEVLGRIKQHPGDGPLALLLEYTDNKDWVEAHKARFSQELPTDTKYYLAPLSPSSAVHMGPGTWGVAVTRL